ncbi:MAG: helix-turn-helix domain-containing protein [Bacillus sp. (in: Bacteria)]|nr:helix-turn-helix domain-containing protein [Bacillus sp. (in: firmicutes)]MCM1426742.1 helix-turn-helix domain-containing protein [Eubacterium sp.]
MDKTTNLRLAQYLKELRKSHGYQQEFVASHLNITRQTYSHYETGRITPPVNSLYNLAALYGIPVENFMEFLVTYNINSDFVKKPTSLLLQEPAANLSEFMSYINRPEQSKKFKLLDHNEKLLLYYYQLLDQRDREDVLTFLKVKYENRRQERS